MSENKSKVAWPGVSRGGGNLDEDIQNKLRTLLNEFGTTLEEEGRNSGLNIFVFPIFREFNLLAGVNNNNAIFVISPSQGGIPRHIWMDWRNNPNNPTKEQIAGSVQQQFGWSPISYIQFPVRILGDNFIGKDRTIRNVASRWIEDAITEKERAEKIVRVKPIFRGREFLIDNELSFVLMPFREPFLRIYGEVIRPALTKYFRVMRANDIFTPTAIIDDIWEYINKSRLIVADVTDKNPNVFYELGIAHTVGKDVVIITQNDDDIPFDLKHLRYIKYVDNNTGWKSLAEELDKFVRSTVKKS